MPRPYDPSRARTMRDDCYCSCFDCNRGGRCGDMEQALRDGTYEWLCFDCYVASGDDNYHSCLRHDKELGRAQGDK